MSISECSDNETARERSFWRKNSKSLPGSIMPANSIQLDGTHQENGSVSLPEKEQAENSVPVIFGDSWRDSSSSSQDSNKVVDNGSDDDLVIDFLNVKLSRQAVYSTAAKVLENHSNQQRVAEIVNTADEKSAKGPTEPDNILPFVSPSSVLGAVSPVSQRLFGPGVGIRLARPHCSEPSSKFCPAVVNEHDQSKLDKFSTILGSPSVDLDALRRLSWSGIPSKFRPLTWKLLSGYVSPNQDRRIKMLERKRLEYHTFVNQYYSTRHQDIHQDTYRQIHIDIPRMSPLIPLFQQQAVQQLFGIESVFDTVVDVKIFERILYIWAIRHPASGYVQGINDLVTPFFVVFLLEYIDEGSPVENCQINNLPTADVQKLEADCFWCFSKLLDGIQDNYTFAQPGIQTRVNSLKDLVSRIDYNLHRHFESLSIEYLQFAFRWMNNLLMREIPLRCVIRLWDTYMNVGVSKIVSWGHSDAKYESQNCSFIACFECDRQTGMHNWPEIRVERNVASAGVGPISTDVCLLETPGKTLLVLLQNLPTEEWTDEEIGVVLADAYRLKYMFADAPRHLQ